MPKQTFFNLPQDKRDRIIDVAIDEFAENEYRTASISHMVDQADIAKGSFYQYFADKEDLYRYILQIAGEQKQQFLRDRPPPSDMNVFAYLRWLALEGVRFELAHPRLAQIGYRAVSGGGYPPEFIAEATEQGMTFFRQLVALGKSQGDIAPEIDEDLAAFLFNTVFVELGQYIVRRFPEHFASVAPGTGTVRAFFESEQVQQVFDETITILEFGMGQNRSNGLSRLEYDNDND